VSGAELHSAFDFYLSESEAGILDPQYVKTLSITEAGKLMLMKVLS
jgi:hypothetical protein